MIEKKIVVCIGTDRIGNVRARLSLMVVDGASVLSEHYHSINIAPGEDMAALRAVNEANIADADGGVPGAPWGAIPDAEWEKVEQVVSAIQTPEVVAAYRATLPAQE